MNNKQSKQNSNPYKITFDADARKEFILGVKKRKNERRQQYLEAKARKEHRDKLERRRQLRLQRYGEDGPPVIEVNQETGYDAEALVNNYKPKDEDDIERVQVTVQPMDLSKNDLLKDESSSSDNEEMSTQKPEILDEEQLEIRKAVRKVVQNVRKVNVKPTESKKSKQKTKQKKIAIKKPSKATRKHLKSLKNYRRHQNKKKRKK